MGAKAKKIVYGDGGRKTDAHRQPLRRKSGHGLFSNDEEILTLARWAVAIESHYARPMDIEWAKDGETGELFIVQARPETVQSRREAGSLKTYTLKQQGRASADRPGDRRRDRDRDRCAGSRVPPRSPNSRDGAILVTETTDPDWMPIMKRAAAIITDHGGRTSHAAIVSRELGLPAIVGTGKATAVLESGREVTVSCAEGDMGYVYDGIGEFEVRDLALENIAATSTKVMLNMANPAAAMRWWRLPADGIGLARMEFIINNIIKIHPMALVKFDELKDAAARRRIARLTAGIRGQDAVLRRHAGLRNRPDRGLALSQSGDRPDERFQDQRVCAAYRRQAVRAAMKRIRCSDGAARAAITARAIARVSRWNAAPSARCARKSDCAT